MTHKDSGIQIENVVRKATARWSLLAFRCSLQPLSLRDRMSVLTLSFLQAANESGRILSGDRWFLSWLSFNLHDRRKKAGKEAGRLGSIRVISLPVRASLIPHPPRGWTALWGADAWNRRFSWSCDLSWGRAVASFYYLFILAHLVKKNLSDCRICG